MGILVVSFRMTDLRRTLRATRGWERHCAVSSLGFSLDELASLEHEQALAALGELSQNGLPIACGQRSGLQQRLGRLAERNLNLLALCAPLASGHAVVGPFRPKVGPVLVVSDECSARWLRFASPMRLVVGTTHQGGGMSHRRSKEGKTRGASRIRVKAGKAGPTCRGSMERKAESPLEGDPPTGTESRTGQLGGPRAPGWLWSPL